MNFDEILKYQECEQKIVEINSQVNNSQAKKQVSEKSSVIKSEQDNIRSLNNKADGIEKDYESMVKKCKTLLAEIEAVAENASKLNDEIELKKALDKISDINGNLDMLMRAISVSGKEAENMGREFNTSKNKIAEARVAGNSAKAALNKLTEGAEPKKAELQQQLKALEKSVDKALLGRYKQARADNIFPVFVPLTGNACGGCGMQLSTAFINKLKEKGCNECESCRRLVFIKS